MYHDAYSITVYSLGSFQTMSDFHIKNILEIIVTTQVY